MDDARLFIAGAPDIGGRLAFTVRRPVATVAEERPITVSRP